MWGPMSEDVCRRSCDSGELDVVREALDQKFPNQGSYLVVQITSRGCGGICVDDWSESVGELQETLRVAEAISPSKQTLLTSYFARQDAT